MACFIVVGFVHPVAADNNGNGNATSVVQRSNLYDFITEDPLIGAGILTRTAKEIWLSFSATDLDPSAAYSVWWVVFNKPNACTGGCGEDDLFDPAVKASVFHAGGFVTSGEGSANINAHLRTGRIPNGSDVVIGEGSVIGGPDSCGAGVDCDTGIKPGLKKHRGKKAEVHVVVRTHGPAVAGWVEHQIGTFDGACGVCADQSFLVFPPVN
jgi:hypothetical protein